MQSDNEYVSAESVQDGVSSPKSASESQTEAINSPNMAGTSPKTLNLSPAKVNMSPSKASRGTFVGGTILKVSPAGKAMGQFQSEIWNEDNSTGGFVAECVKAKELKDLPKTSIKDRSGPNLLMWLHDNPTTKYAHTITHPSRYGLPDAQDTQKDVTFVPFNIETDR
ncbi:hypothetical protein SARC_05520 [Sphaeroforma arctica JP610]|uniref:Uncharacterized protein n=1 Tax=Sphaeroforma arctica JP610 TaxID=667725 RepID=A0A0L0G028_9EUKA|nr:hypothetical protein SARC_05520 [Sphaeroforma arctica JP610]KNC82181.1 hypothetical protein SARC_05520 [Sphaeroforma arctica JP610]|eukprot:XP_014156083.1 hypothetical protein SARC_05520 [Sphaeroforma arctica JP610]